MNFLFYFRNHSKKTSFVKFGALSPLVVIKTSQQKSLFNLLFENLRFNPDLIRREFLGVSLSFFLSFFFAFHV